MMTFRNPARWAFAFVVVAVIVLGAGRADATAVMSWPVNGPVIREFDRPRNDYSAGHRGIDIGALRGRVIRSPIDGVVWFSGVVAGKSVISIDTADGAIVSLEPVESALARGDAVHRGEVIGLVSGTHDEYSAVHLGVRINGTYEDPLRFLGPLPRIVVYDSSIDSYALG